MQEAQRMTPNTQLLVARLNQTRRQNGLGEHYDGDPQRRKEQGCCQKVSHSQEDGRSLTQNETQSSKSSTKFYIIVPKPTNSTNTLVCEQQSPQ